MSKRLFTGLAMAGTLAIAAQLLVHAQGGPGSGGEGPRAGMQREEGSPRHERMHRHHHHGGHGMHHGGGEMGGFGFGPRSMRGLDLSEEQVSHSRSILRRFGNMSSATILFVLEETLQKESPVPDDWGLMIGLGPGFAAEGALLRW